MIENANEGNDTVYASVNYQLTANVENLVLQGSGHLRARQRPGERALRRPAATTSWTAMPAPTSMYGGAGNDAYFVDNIGDLVIENANEGSDTVYAIGQLPAVGERGDLVLQGSAVQGYGNGLANTIYGTSGRQHPRRRCRRRHHVWRGRQRRVFPRQHRRFGIRERQRGQRHGLCIGQLPAVGERGVPGAARQRRPGLRQRPGERDLRHQRDNLLDGDAGADSMLAAPATTRIFSTTSATW